MLEMLRKRFVATGIDSLSVDRIALFRQDALDTRFRIVGDWPLVEDLIHP